MQKADTLIRTKLHLPFIRSELVSRPRLQEGIKQGLQCPLTLITAPAGFGKTTLVASCVVSFGLPIAWLSLDKEDNRTGRFLNYLVASLQEANIMVGSDAAQLLDSTQQAPFETLLTSLINDLLTTPSEIILVLDDYQFISNQIVHDNVTFLIDHCPKNLHLVIATRSDPPLPLSRLRARDQVVEFRAADLRFSELEAAQFLNEVMGLHLDERSITVLEERTEGWIAGLQMAALSLRDRKDVIGFIEGFSGTNRYIMEYLLEEILAKQPPEIQRFLLYTSILDRLTAPLCDALLNLDIQNDLTTNDRIPDSELSNRQPSTTILEYLERKNLFLVSLDENRRWYRYHHLFADLLRAHLDKLNPGLKLRLHIIAATWLEHEGMTIEAVNHALAAREFDVAASLVEENTKRLIVLGEMNTLMSWIEALPVEQRLAKPWLCIHQAYVMMFAGRPMEVEPLLVQAESAMRSTSAPGSESLADRDDKFDVFLIMDAKIKVLKGAIAAVRAFTAVTMGQDVEGQHQIQQANKLIPAEDLFDQSLVAWALGKIMQNKGRLVEARLAFEDQFRLGRDMGNTWTQLAGQTYVAQVLQNQGQLSQARVLLENALSEATKQGARSRGYIAWVQDSLVSVLYEQNELETANNILTEAIDLIHQWPNPTHLVYTYALQARILLALRNYKKAQIAIAEVDKIRMSVFLTRGVRRIVEADIVRAWLLLQRVGIKLVPDDPLVEHSKDIVASWQNEMTNSAKGDDTLMDVCTEIASLTLARVAITNGQNKEALTLLQPIIRNAQNAGHIGTAIDALVLSAIALQDNSTGTTLGNNRTMTAFAALEKALLLGNSGGYLRTFLNEGKSMQMLITKWLMHADSNPLRNYAINLLSLFDLETQSFNLEDEKRSQNGNLIEPLSQRELEVLHLMALGKTNPQIAQQLFVASGTIKAHAANIYRKLDVANRTEAVARARQLGILA